MADPGDPGSKKARELILARRRFFIASAVATLALTCDKGRPDVCLKVYVPPTPDPEQAGSATPTPSAEPPKASAAPADSGAPVQPGGAPAPSAEPMPCLNVSETPAPPPTRAPRPKPAEPRMCLLMLLED